jgi:CDGSH-type Zn-finger protein
MKDKGPLILKRSDIDGDDLWMCRCGLSANWPLCDDSHLKTKGEEASATYEYARAGRHDEPARAATHAHTGADPRPWDKGNRKLKDAKADS